MPWNPVAAMTVVDLVVATAAIIVLRSLWRGSRHARSLGVQAATWLIMLGLLAVAGFHVVDFYVMWVLPVQEGELAAARTMSDLHLDWRWIVTLFEVGAIAGGLLLLSSRLYPDAAGRIEALEERCRALEEELDESRASERRLLEAARRTPLRSEPRPTSAPPRRASTP